MRQRLALERALLHEPRLVLLDEPFTGLDDTATGALRARLHDLRTSGCIVLVTTHDLETIEGLVDRAVLLHNGRLVTIGTGAGTLREKYRQASAVSVSTPNSQLRNSHSESLRTDSLDGRVVTRPADASRDRPLTGS
jgi:ABC-type multidrug transport system ATPase subunit